MSLAMAFQVRFCLVLLSKIWSTVSYPSPLRGAARPSLLPRRSKIQAKSSRFSVTGSPSPFRGIYDLAAHGITSM